MKLAILIKSDDLSILEDKAHELNLIMTVSRYLKRGFMLHIAQLATETNSERDARSLSKFRTFIDECTELEYLTLSDDSSAYFERKLFKRLADFERGLRTILYLRSCKEDGDIQNEVIAGLEGKTFGEVFDDLFICSEFNDQVRKTVHQKGQRFEKRTIIEKISAMHEDTLWSRLFNDDEMPTIRERHSEIRWWRNDVMHAHAMSYEHYSEARNVITKANEEISRCIDEITGHKSGKRDAINEFFKPFVINSSFMESMQNISQIYSSIWGGIDTSAFAAAREATKSLQDNLSQYQHIMGSIAETMRPMSGLSESLSASHCGYTSDLMKRLGSNEFMVDSQEEDEGDDEDASDVHAEE